MQLYSVTVESIDLKPSNSNQVPAIFLLI